jgi:acyl carrier protein
MSSQHRRFERMVDPEVEGSVKAVLHEVTSVDVAAMGPETVLEDLGLDSVSALDVIARVEERFDLRIPEDDALHLDTVGAITRYVIRAKKA